jgi:hypothetical protein
MSADGDLEKGVGPTFLVRNWSPAFKEWPTKATRDAFYVFPRILNAAGIKESIARAVEAYGPAADDENLRLCECGYAPGVTHYVEYWGNFNREDA